MNRLALCAARLVPAAVMASTLGAQARWTVDPTPVVDIKGTSDKGEIAFATANWAMRAANGSILVADNGLPGVRVFDAKGQPTKAIGRAGQGPGEFQTAFWIGECAKDSLFVWDLPRRRMSVFAANGTFGRSFMPPSESDALAVSCNHGGTIAMFGFGRMGPGAKVTTVSPPGSNYAIRTLESKVALSDVTGAAKGTIDSVPSGEVLALSRGGGGPRPLGKATSIAVSNDRIFVGTGEPSVAVYDIAGKKTGVVNIEGVPRASTRAHYERATAVVASMFPAQMRDTATKRMLEVPPPEKLPPYSALRTDGGGLLWVVTSVPGDKDTQLRAYRADGQLVATAVVSVNLNVFEVGADYILGSREDSDGEQHVVMYRLHRAR